MLSDTLNTSFDENDPVDINSVIVTGESDAEVQRKLSVAFDGCIPKDAAESMKVLLRIRPISSKADSTIVVESETSILTNAPESSKRAQYTKTEARNYMFSKVFKPDTSQFDVYDASVGPMLKRFLAGENCVMFAYGMTNSGKTYTMQGSNINPGILPRLVASVQEAMEAQSPAEFDIKMSMLEIYQDKIFDLLGKDKKKLSIRDGNGKVEVKNLSQHPVATTSDAFQLMDTAASNRTKATTFLNTNSSRSHAVYNITLTRANAEGMEVTSSFYLVDLAGAERGNRTRATATQQKEANNINVSLMQLWRCLGAMKKNSRGKIDDSIIPFRDSKLTHLLMPILCRAGLKGVTMMVCVNPQVEDYDETLSILGNASLACRIREIVDLGRTVTAALMAPPEIKEKVYGMSLKGLKEYKDKNNTRKDSAESSNSIAELGATSSSVGDSAATETLSVATEAAAASGATGKKRGRDSTLTTTSGHGKPIVSAYAQHKMRDTTAAGKKKTAAAAALAAGKKMAIANAATSRSANEFDEDEPQPDVKRMKSEIEELKEQNALLIASQEQLLMQRETEIRIEVSEEMAAHSQHLLNEIEYLRDQVSDYENAQSSGRKKDLTRSVKKAAKRQREIIQQDAESELREAEEEFERMKGEYDVEINMLKAKVVKLEAELKQYSAMKALMGSGAKKGKTASSTVKNLMGFGSGAANYACTASEVSNPLNSAAPNDSNASEFRQRMVRSTSQRMGESSAVQDENSGAQAPSGAQHTKTGGVQFKKSPNRSPLSSVSPNAGSMARAASPLKPVFKAGGNLSPMGGGSSPQRARTGGPDVVDLTGASAEKPQPYFRKLRSHFGRA